MADWKVVISARTVRSEHAEARRAAEEVAERVRYDSFLRVNEAQLQGGNLDFTMLLPREREFMEAMLHIVRPYFT